MNELTIQDLREMQEKPLEWKEQQTLGLISEWYAYFNNNCYVSFSGGKDSTVLADIAAKWCYIAGVSLRLTYVDTGLEYPETKKHVRNFAEYLRNKYGIEVILDILRPKIVFSEVVSKFGYPVISKAVSQKIAEARNGNASALRYFDSSDPKYGRGSRYSMAKYRELLSVDFRISSYCCDVMKKAPLHAYSKTMGASITGTMAIESQNRTTTWLRYGCNAFGKKEPSSTPLSFWTEQDIYAYIQKYNIPIASVYGEVIETKMGDKCEYCTTGCNRTGCVFCAYGVHLEKGETRFEKLKKTHPKLWQYCIYGGGYDSEDGLWKPTKDGLGMGYVFDVLNDLYSKTWEDREFIEYGKE